MNNRTEFIQLEEALTSLKKDTAGVPSPTFRTNARIRVLNTVTTVNPLRASWYRRPRVLGYTVGTAIATVVLSVGTVFAAQSSLPNSALYPVKVFSENVALTLSPNESIKTTVASSIISRRVTETEALQKQGNAEEIRQSISRLNADVTSIEKRKDVTKSEIEQTINNHKQFFDSVNGNHAEEKSVESDHPSVQGASTVEPTIQETPKDSPTPTHTSLPEIKLPETNTTHEDN